MNHAIRPRMPSRLPALLAGSVLFATLSMASGCAVADNADGGERNGVAPEPRTPVTPPAPVAPVTPVAPAAPVAPLAPELAGFADRSLAAAMGQLHHLQSLERLTEFSAMIDSDQIEAAVEAAMANAEAEMDSAASRYAERYSSDSNGPSISETRSLKSNGRVSVNNVAGIVEVSVWDRNEVSVAGRLGSTLEKLEITGDSNALSVLVRLPKGSRNGGDTVLELKVPNNAQVDLETVSADVVVNGTRGPLKVNTVSGDIVLDLASSEVSVQTVSGDLHLKAPAARQTRLNSISGDIHLEGLSGALALETVSGNVDLEKGGRFGDLQLKSISGDINLDLSLADIARVNGQTLSGEITMVIPQDQNGTALLKSFSGDAECEGATTVENSSNRKREYTWGNGRGARVELSSFSGDIRVERK